MADNVSLENVRRLRFAIENSASFGSQLDDSYFEDIKSLDGTVKYETTVQMLPNTTMRQRVNAQLRSINTTRRVGKFGFSSYLNGTNTAASANVLSIESPNGKILKTVMGGEHRTSGSLCNGLSFADGVYLIEQNYHYFPGTPFGLINPSTNKLEAQVVRMLSTGSLPVVAYTATAFEFVPLSGSTVYGASTYFLTQDPQNTLQFFAESGNATDSFKILGCQGGFTLKMDLNTIPQINYDFQTVNFNSGSNSGSLDEATYTDGQPPAILGCQITLGANTVIGGAATVSASQDWQSFELTPAITYSEVPSTSEDSGIMRFRMNADAPVLTGKFVTSLNTGRTWYDARTNQTAYNLGILMGSEPGKSCFIHAPNVKITNVQDIGASGLWVQEVTFECYEQNISNTTFNGATWAQVPTPSSQMSVANQLNLLKSAFKISFI